jgi:Holliday junction resolvase RusA-like endonuclease
MERMVFISGKTIHQKRHRHFLKNGRVIIYDPSSKEKRSIVKTLLTENDFEETINYTCSVSITVQYQRPKSHYGTGSNSDKLKQNAPQHPGVKPDIDNVAKAYLDILVMAKVIRDDCLVNRLEVSKVYGKDPSVEIEVWSNG